MADVIDKIGKYFADQEAQLRERYAQVAATAARANGASIAVPPAARRGELAAKSHAEVRPSSLLRRRLTATREGGRPAAFTRAGSVEGPWWMATHEQLSARSAARSAAERSESSRDDRSTMGSRWTTSESGGDDDAASSSALSTRSSKSIKMKKRKKKKKKISVDMASKEEEEKAKQQRAAEGLARAQERARRLQTEKAERERQQQSEREASAARLQEEMRKIEEIRRRGKTFAMRLRPQSAPTTPQTRTPQSREETNVQTWTVDDAASKPQEEMEPKPRVGFLAEIERRMKSEMLAEMEENERLFLAHTQEAEEHARLEAQLRKANDLNAIKQERVDSLIKAKEAMEKEIQENQALALDLKQQRLQLEEKSRRERQLKQREAEREIHARLLREESQRLVDEERRRSDVAAEARAKAKQRVQSRAALLKRVLHGCDIRSETKPSRNQDEEDRDANKTETKRAPSLLEMAPELAEFEEDGLTGCNDPPHSPPRQDQPLLFRGVLLKETGSFQWSVPKLSNTQIHEILREELTNLSDGD